MAQLGPPPLQSVAHLLPGSAQHRAAQSPTSRRSSWPPEQVDPRYLAMLFAFEDRRFYSHYRRRSLRHRPRRPRSRPEAAHRHRRLHADHAGRAPARQSIQAHAIGEAAPDRPRLPARAAAQQATDPRPLPRPRPLRRARQRRARRLAQVLRQGAAQAFRSPRRHCSSRCRRRRKRGASIATPRPRCARATSSSRPSLPPAC